MESDSFQIASGTHAAGSVSGGTFNTLLETSLPEKVGMSVEALSGNNLTLAEKLNRGTQPRSTSDDFSNVFSQAIQDYVRSVADESQVTVRTITLTTAAGTTSITRPITIQGTTGTGEGDTVHSHRQEALIIDTRNLPPGTKLSLDKVEFAIIIGPTGVIGGVGNNFVIGDSTRQTIVLGEGDDNLYGGGGDDIVGSKGGNDFISGDTGNDWLVGGIDHDTLKGGDGNDLLQGGASDLGV